MTQTTKLIEVSETIRDHLTKQNAQAFANGDCLYKSHDGKMCAVGCLIKPEYYNEKFEGRGVSDADIIEAVTNSVGLVVDRNAIDDLAYGMLSGWQAYHDEEYDSFVGGANDARSPAVYHDYMVSALISIGSSDV